MPGFNRRQVLRSILASSAAALIPRSALKAAAPARLEPVRRHILQAIQEGRATGVSMAVVYRGQIAWEDGFGLADREHGVAVTSNTPFSVASLTKTFTATLVTTLAAQGLVQLDSPASQYLRHTPLHGPNGNPDAITVRMLGAHCSGLPLTFAAYLTNGPLAAPSTAVYLRDYGRLAYPPGEIYEYGNIGFEALGAIVSNISGQQFGVAMEQRVLKPLGLRSSFFSNAVDRLRSAAAGYDAENQRIPDYTTSTPPSGELYASAHDLARFALFNLGRPLSGATPILSERWLHEVHSTAYTGPRRIATTFGWFTGKLPSGEAYLFKGGGQPGVAAKIFVLPSADLACVVLTNRTDAMPLIEECCEEVIRTYVPDFTIPKEDAGAASTPFAPGPEFLGTWKGRVSNGGADQPVLFTMRADGQTTLALSGRAPQAVRDIQGQPPGFEGTVGGLIDCNDSAAFGSRTLALKLIPHQDRLIGRVTARGTRPGVLLANIPYVLTLERS
jgi:CubicO group peptidase (beta-lactamase class C family)